MAESLQTQLGLDPTAIVLAKVKGYPAWPAMVLQYDLLPENIQQLKPKSVKQTKKGPPIVAVPVRFFSDNTYIWIKSVDLKPLPKDAIAAFLQKRSRKTDPLVQAYTLAQDPPDMAEFIRWGSEGPPTEIPESADEEVEAPEPPRKKLKLKLSTKKTDTNARKDAKTKSESKSKSKPKPKPKANSKSEPEEMGDGFADYAEFEKELDQEDSGLDSDWGIDDAAYDYAEGDYVFDDEVEQKRFVDEFPSAADLAHTLQYYNKYLTNLHRQLSPGLLAGDFVEKEVVREVREVTKLLSRNELPLVVFTRSRLFRSLLLVLHKPKEAFTLRTVRGAVQDLMGTLNLSPCEVTLDDLVVEETPEAEPVAETIATEVIEVGGVKADVNAPVGSTENLHETSETNTAETIKPAQSVEPSTNGVKTETVGPNSTDTPSNGVELH